MESQTNLLTLNKFVILILIRVTTFHYGLCLSRLKGKSPEAYASINKDVSLLSSCMGVSLEALQGQAILVTMVFTVGFLEKLSFFYKVEKLVLFSEDPIIGKYKAREVSTKATNYNTKE